MATTISIDNLLEVIETDIKEKNQKRLLNLKKTYEKLKEFSIIKGVSQVERIPVKPSVIEQEIISHRTYNKWLNKYDEETETVKEKKIEIENILEALRVCKPNEIDKTIHWFNNGKFYFCTDLGVPYNLRTFPRPLTSEEEKQIENLIKEIEEDKAESEKVLFSARILIASETLDTFRTPEQEKELNSAEGIIERMELSKIIEREKKFNRFFNYETWKRHYILNAKKNKEEHLEKLNKALDKICFIYEQAENEPQFFIHPMKQNRQLKIYISKSCSWFFRRLGYDVKEEKRSYTATAHKESHGSIIKEEKEFFRTSYYFQMNLNAFVSSCLNGKVAKKGFTFDEDGNEVEIKNGRPIEEVTIIDENGIKHNFQSKTDAAREFNLSNAQVTKILSNGGRINRKKKEITLKSADGSILSFSSMTQLAKELNTSKSKITRTLKNKNVGDKV